MLTEICNLAVYSATFLSLFAIDYLLGHGFLDMFKNMICRMFCFVRKSIKEDEKRFQIEANDNTLRLPVLIAEIMCLGFTIAFLNKYKHIRGKDKIDELLQESRESLRQTNEFLEKWRLRRLIWQVPEESSYLDDEPQDIKPYKLEVPILHMAIVDTLGTTRNQLERGDAGDTINITDSTLLSLTSILGSISEPSSEEKLSDPKGVEHGNRILWNVLEEDLSTEN